MSDEQKPILFEGFEKAFMGMLRRYGEKNPIAVYDYNECMEILMDRDGMQEDEAVEWLEHNTLGAYLGESTPAMVFPCTLREVVEECDMDPSVLEEEDYGDVDESKMIGPDDDYDDVRERLTEEQQEKLDTAVSDFALNFIRYVKEVEPNLFLRAKQYAADFSGNDMIEFVIEDEEKEKDKE